MAQTLASGAARRMRVRLDRKASVWIVAWIGRGMRVEAVDGTRIFALPA
jgi:hypothetical protein